MVAELIRFFDPLPHLCPVGEDQTGKRTRKFKALGVQSHVDIGHGSRPRRQDHRDHDRGQAGGVIGRNPDGRAILFSHDSPYRNLLRPGQEVECRVVRVAPRYIIVDAISEPVPLGAPRPERADRVLLDELELISKGDDTNSVFAKALLHLIERVDGVV